MPFEERELKPYAEPVSARDLKEGAVYFFVNFADEEMLIPVVEPMVFIGRNLDANDAGLMYFQDIDSYQVGLCYDSDANNREAHFYTGSESETNHVFEFEKALDVLLRCSLRRRKGQQ